MVVVLVLAATLTIAIVFKKQNRIQIETLDLFKGNADSSIQTYIDLQGNKVTLEKWLGEPIVVVSWASWSPFSADNLITLDNLANEFTAKKIKFIAINRKENLSQALRYLQTLPALQHIMVVIDTEDLFYTTVGGYAMPETVIYDARGNVILHEHGVVSIDLIRQTITPLLAE